LDADWDADNMVVIKEEIGVCFDDLVRGVSEPSESQKGESYVFGLTATWIIEIKIFFSVTYHVNKNKIKKDS
jgi:hypothetical protein